jgi:hypothetical protein
MSTSAVKMVDEKVQLRMDLPKRAWEVDCSFVFENTTGAPVKLQVGFPFPAMNSQNGDVAKPTDAPELRDAEPMVWDFKTWVRGKPVTARKSKTGVSPDQPALEYEYAFLWDVEFAPFERVHIRNTYRHGISAQVGGMEWAEYVLMTGSTWAGGTIGHARLSVVVESSRHVLCPANDGAFDAPKPAGSVLSPNHGAPGFELHWSLHDHRPETNLTVCLQNLDSYAQMHFATELQEMDLTGKTLAELERLRNEPYALHGYPFKDEALAAYFSTKWWYKPDPSFSPKRLSKEELAFVARVVEAEKAAGKK